ncbi:unnamed protein product [Effrenium voratum]|nr:unnamed protein product [Effrenium voratum]
MENALGAVGEAQASAVQHMAMQQLMPGMGLASCGVPVICCEVEEEEEDTTATGRFLRLCVHHGKNLPKVACFAEVVFDTGKASEVRERSAPVGACFCPTWDLQVEHSLRRKLPSVEVLIKTSGCIPRQVAHGWLVPVENGSEVQVVELELGTSTGFCEEEVQKVVVAYQLVNSGDLRLDLARAADLGTAGVQQSKFRLQALVRGVQFKHSLNAGEEVRLRVYTMHSSGLTEDKEIRRSVDAEAKSVKKFEFGDSAKGDEEMLWELVASEVSLGRYDLVVEAYLRPEGTEAEVVGVWSEPLNQLYDTIQSRQLKLLFRAHLRKGLRHTGYLELMLDLHRVSDAPHQTPLIAQNRKAVLQARKGRREEGDEQFYVHVAALGLQVPCPYLKVISAGDSGATDEFEADESKKRCGEWVKSLPVKTTSSNSQVRLELWADSSETLLLGQTLIFDGFPDRPPCWRHLFGAAELAREPEAAEKMARGRLEPSTHRASLHVTFSRFSGKLPEKLSEMRNTQTPVQLTVRFYRALYLDRYAGSRVQVRVQLAGCMAGESKDVLAFDAKVDERGVARFSESGAHGKTNAWVEKSSSLLSIPQDVSSAYFYIVRQGEEGYAPEVYGKIPLSFSKAKVDWVEARCDASAAEAPRWAEVQGMVLGSAHVTRVQEAEPKESSAEEVPGVEVYCHLDFLAARCLPSADEDNLVDPCYEVRVEDQSLQLKSPVRRTLNPTFLHRLLIGPIRLPEVKVADGKLSEEQPVSLPPVHIRITDKDEGFMGSTSYTPLGQAFLVDPKILDGEAKHAEGGGLVLDVNQSHRAFWYALGDNKHIPFDHVLDPAWVSRPRILAAAGYSCTASTVTRAQQDERQADPQICRIYTEHSLKYDITVDVLGVRELQNYGTKLELALTPFWSTEGSKKAKKIYIGLDHSNTGKGRAESPGASEFRQRMEPLINWAAKDAIETPPVLDEDAAGADNSSDSEEEDNSGEWRPLKLKTSQSRGWRVSVSNYSAPIIPYLQVSFHKQLPKTEAPKDPSAQAEAAADRAKPLLAPFVLLPDLVFSVKDEFSGDDLGSVCVMLPVNHRHLSVAKQMSEALRLCSVKEQTVPQDSEQLALVKGEVVEVLHRDISGWSFGRQVLPDGGLKEGWFPDWASERLFSDELWVEQSVREFQSLEDRLRCLPRIPPQPDHGSVYDIYVDVFAAASGELMWNEDFHVDKSLTQQHLFTIQGKDDTPVLQYFNPADWMLGDRRSADECAGLRSFDARVSGTMQFGVLAQVVGACLRNRWPGARGHAAVLVQTLFEVLVMGGACLRDRWPPARQHAVWVLVMAGS